MNPKKSLEKIRQNKVFLLDTLSGDAEIILQNVQQAGLITQREYRNLTDIPQREARIISLLDKLMNKGEETCHQFITLLRKDDILENFPKLKDCAIFVSLVPEVPLYKIEKNPRGTCVIINNVNFSTLSERRGSDKDQKDLARVFRWLGFEVVEHRNKTAEEMKTILKDVGRTVDGDCFVCCVLSHGVQQGVYGTDDTSADAVVSVDEIREPFTGNNCQKLAGKPKLFFIQACRGKKYSAQVKVQADAPGDEESEMEVDAVAFDITIPDDTDFLIARSTTDGHVSFRKPEEGSWFIQSLCKNLEKHCPLRTDIQTILVCVNDEVSKEGSRCKQMPVHEVAMRKKLILPPVNH